jgi:hypothetical protein
MDIVSGCVWLNTEMVVTFLSNTGLRLNMNNINQARIPTIRCQMLLHILKKAQANDNNEVLPVGPDRQEANANNPLVLLSGPEEDSDKRSAHIDGMSDVDGGDNGNYVGETIDAAYDVDDGEEDDASQTNDNTDAGQDGGGNNNEVDGGRDQENAGKDNNNYYLPLKQTESIKPNADESMPGISLLLLLGLLLLHRIL